MSNSPLIILIFDGILAVLSKKNPNDVAVKKISTIFVT
jgi:hypothetical protein